MGMLFRKTEEDVVRESHTCAIIAEQEQVSRELHRPVFARQVKFFYALDVVLVDCSLFRDGVEFADLELIKWVDLFLDETLLNRCKNRLESA